MAETYLITGGAGNLACQLTFDLARQGHAVVLMDVAQRPVAPIAEGCEYIRADITQPAEISTAFAQYKPDVVLHFASLLSGKSEEDRPAAWRVNMEGAFTLFEAAVAHNVSKFFFPSSLAAYGGALPNPLPEDFPNWPGGFYGVTKSSVERMGVYYHVKHGLDFRAVRLPAVISAFAPPGAASAYLSRAFVEAVTAGGFTFKVRPGTSPSVVYVKDVLGAIVGLLDASPDRLTRRVYNIYAMAPSAAELAGAITQRAPDARLAFDPDPHIVGLIESWPRQIDDASARRDWGWQPRYDLNTLADDFIQELRSEAEDASGV